MFAGAYTALITPFRPDGAVDYDRLRALVEFQIAGGIDGLVPVGTTGESPTVDVDEHIELIRVDVASGANGNSAAVNQVTTVSTTSAPSYNSFGELAGGVTGLLEQVPTNAYQVQQGDNLRSLCTKFYDTPHDWPTLAQLNGLSACDLPADLKQLSLPTSQEALTKAKSLIQTYATDKWPTLKLPTSWEDIA